MTAHARTRPRLAERFADLFRGHRRLPDPPLLYPMGAPARPRGWGTAWWLPEPARAGQVVPQEGDVAACRKCHLTVSLLGGTWTCIEDDPRLFGETNCGADLSAVYAPHEPVTGRDGSYVLPADLAEAAGRVLAGGEDVDPGSHVYPGPAVYAGDPWVPEDAVYADDPRPEPHPPWHTAPQPALAGPSRLGAFYAAADLRDQRAQLEAEHQSWYGWGTTATDTPVGRARPYAPESEPVHPPLSFKADFRDLPVFRTAARKCGLAPAGLVRAGGVTP